MIQDGAVTVSEKNSRFIEISFFRKISFAIFYLEYFSVGSFSIFATLVFCLMNLGGLLMIFS